MPLLIRVLYLNVYTSICIAEADKHEYLCPSQHAKRQTATPCGCLGNCLSSGAEESSFLEDGCPTYQLTLQLYHQAQASLSTGAGGCGLSSAEARRVSASVGSLVATVPEVLADLSGAIEDKVRRELPAPDLVRRIWRSVRDLRDMHGVSEEAMANIVLENWLDRACRAGEQDASGQSIAEELPAHNAETISSVTAQN